MNYEVVQCIIST